MLLIIRVISYFHVRHDPSDYILAKSAKEREEREDSIKNYCTFKP